MPKQSKRNVKLPAKAAVTKPVAAKPVTNTAPLGTAAAAQAPRSNVVKPVTTNPATPTVAKAPAGINRTAATIARGACNFGGVLSDRDTAYLTFYAGIAKRTGHATTVTAIHASGKRPVYEPSNKPHDAGVIQRLAKAGLCTVSNGGHDISFTAKARDLAAYKAAN